MKRLLLAAFLLSLPGFLSAPLLSQWVQTSGPEGGSISGLAANDSMVFAATYSGVFRSSND